MKNNYYFKKFNTKKICMECKTKHKKFFNGLCKKCYKTNTTNNNKYNIYTLCNNYSGLHQVNIINN